MKNKNAIIEEITLKTLSSCLFAASLSALLALFMCTSLAGILFNGKLSWHVSTGLGMVLLSSVIFNMIFPLFSSYRGAIGLPTASICAVLSLIGNSIMENLNRQTADERVLYTVWAAMLISGFCLNLCFFLMGYYRLGNLIRHLPYQVIGGFMAAISVLLIQSNLKMLLGDQTHFFDLFKASNIQIYGPSIIGALILLEICRYYPNNNVLAYYLICACVVFYLIMSPFYTVSELYKAKLLLGPFPNLKLWIPPSFEIFYRCDYTAIISEIPKIIFLLIAALVPLLLTENALEQSLQEEIHFQDDLIYSSLASSFCLLGGGLPAMPSKTLCSLSAQMRAGSRLVGLLTAFILAFFFSFSGDFLSLMPKQVIAMLLFYLSFKNLSQWLFDMSWKDAIVILSIMTTLCFWGIFEGLIISAICSLSLIIFNQQHGKIIKHCLSGEHYRSYVERPEHLRSILRERAKSLYIIKLQGYLFFGSSSKLINKIKQRLEIDPPLRFLILDFSDLKKYDSSATKSFIKLIQLSKDFKFTLMICKLSSKQEQLLEKENLQGLHRFNTLNDALEWSENQLLKEQNHFETLHDQLKRLSSKKISSLMQHFQKLTVAKGHILIKQGDASNEVYFIESGEVSVQLCLKDGKNILLRKIEPGSVVGEVALYLQTPRISTVIAEKPSVVYKMTREKIDAVKEKDPEAAALFHEYFAWILAERLTDTNELLRSLIE